MVGYGAAAGLGSAQRQSDTVAVVFGLAGWRHRRVEPEVAVLLPDPLAAEVRALLSTGDRIEAVRLTRRRTGLNLLPAVRAVDALGPDRPR